RSLGIIAGPRNPSRCKGGPNIAIRFHVKIAFDCAYRSDDTDFDLWRTCTRVRVKRKYAELGSGQLCSRKLLPQLQRGTDSCGVVRRLDIPATPEEASIEQVPGLVLGYHQDPPIKEGIEDRHEASSMPGLVVTRT